MIKSPIWIILLLIILATLLGYIYNSTRRKPDSDMVYKPNGDMIRYIAVGDSYTIGLGVKPEQRWPNLLVKHLQSNGVNIELVDNIAISGYTVLDAIELELPQLQQLKPDLVTVLIGANDNFGGGEVEIFQKELAELIDGVQKVVSDPKRVVLITIPDHSVSPAVGGSTEDQRLLIEYNQIIKDEAGKRGLSVADIFPVSQQLISPDYFISDGLHPSGKGYIEWEKVIYPVVAQTLRSP